MYFCQIKSFSHQVFYSECNCFKKWTLSRQDKMLPAKVYTVICSRLYVSHVPYYHFTLSLNVYQLTSGWEVDGVAARWEGCRTSGICWQVLSTFVSVTPLDYLFWGDLRIISSLKRPSSYFKPKHTDNTQIIFSVQLIWLKTGATDKHLCFGLTSDSVSAKWQPPAWAGEIAASSFKIWKKTLGVDNIFFYFWGINVWGVKKHCNVQ